MAVDHPLSKVLKYIPLVNAWHGSSVVLLWLGQRKHLPSQKPLGRVFTALQDIRPTDIAMKYWQIRVGYLTRVLVDEVEGNREYLESFEDAHYSISNIQQ